MALYFEERTFDFDGEEYIAIFDEEGSEINYPNHVFQDGDVLLLLNMPLDKDGKHATGWMEYVTYTSPYPHGIWWPEYEDEEVM